MPLIVRISVRTSITGVGDVNAVLVAGSFSDACAAAVGRRRFGASALLGFDAGATLSVTVRPRRPRRPASVH